MLAARNLPLEHEDAVLRDELDRLRACHGLLVRPSTGLEKVPQATHKVPREELHFLLGWLDEDGNSLGDHATDFAQRRRPNPSPNVVCQSRWKVGKVRLGTAHHSQRSLHRPSSADEHITRLQLQRVDLRRLEKGDLPSPLVEAVPGVVDVDVGGDFAVLLYERSHRDFSKTLLDCSTHRRETSPSTSSPSSQWEMDPTWLFLAMQGVEADKRHGHASRSTTTDLPARRRLCAISESCWGDPRSRSPLRRFPPYCHLPVAGIGALMHQ